MQVLDDCKEHGVKRVIVEVNIAQASGFYEKWVLRSFPWDAGVGGAEA